MIVVLSMIFELLVDGLEMLLKRCGLPEAKRMMDAAFKELTILGFITLALFSCTRLGFARKINDKYLGVSETEELAIEEAETKGEEPYPPTHLTEIFETIHVLVFIIMIIFIIEVGMLMSFGFNSMRQLQELERNAQTDLHDLVTDPYSSSGRGVHQVLEFWGAAKRFCDQENPLIPIPRPPEPGYPAFSFASYLNKCFAYTLSDMISLPPSIIILTFFIFVLLRPALDLHGRDQIVFMSLTAATLLALTFTAFSFSKYAHQQLRPNPENIATLLLKRQPTQEDEDEALKCPIDDR